ncbi:MAG: helix-turn-helix domain-containing protein [Candidatus Hadarchaeales archaeon]
MNPNPQSQEGRRKFSRYSYCLVIHWRGDRQSLLRLICSLGKDASEQLELLRYNWRALGVVPRRRYRLVTEQEAKEIVKAHGAGETIYSLSRRLGRHASTIWYFLHRLHRNDPLPDRGAGASIYPKMEEVMKGAGAGNR